MGEWWRGLTGRQRVGFLVYTLAAFSMLGSLPVTFSAYEIYGYREANTTGETVVMLARFLVDGTLFTPEENWLDLLLGPLVNFFFVLDFAFLLPGFFLLFLASRSHWFCWSGRVVWTLLFLGGPPVGLLMAGPENEWQIGFWMWGSGMLLVVVAHWVMAPRRITPDGFPPSPESGHSP